MILLWYPSFWVVDCPQYFGVCFSVFFICRHVVLRIISAVYREIWVTRFKFGIVWLSRELTSHNKGLFNIWDNIWDICIPTSVSVTDVHEHLAIIGFLCTQVNCVILLFQDVGDDRIVRETIVIIFIIKNIYILSINQSENKAGICLARILIYNKVIVVSLGVCPDCFQYFILNKILLFVKKNPHI